jgi:hypothetical protein
VHRGRVTLQEQRRYEYYSLQKIGDFTPEFNAVCDAVPDLSRSMELNWDTLEIQNFHRHLDIVNEKVSAHSL